ncbi:MAG: ribonucleotide-diphosphate reductase subunit alpha, partial [Desulfobacterales bacterium]
MGSKGKILITDEGHFDLTTYKWDDQLFSDILAKDNLIESDQAMSISRFLRQEIANMENHTITLPIIDKMIQAKLMEYGLTQTSPIRLDKS